MGKRVVRRVAQAFRRYGVVLGAMPDGACPGGKGDGPMLPGTGSLVCD